MSGAWFDDLGRRFEILRPSPPAFSDPTKAACFPMAPFCNRLRDGRIDFRGRTVLLKANRDDEPYPLHGSTWIEAWRVLSKDQDRAEIGLLHESGDWPWAFAATQTFQVAASGIEITLSVRNLDSSPMPLGLGLHPYFPLTDNVRIQTRVTAAMLTDERSLATGVQAPAEGNFDLSDRTIAQSGLDHGFTGWSGNLSIVYADYSLQMTASDNAKWLQVYAPMDEGYFCAEPVTQANDALTSPESAWAALGIKILEPGQTDVLTVRLQGKAR